MTQIAFIDQASGSLIQELASAAATAFGTVSYYNPDQTVSANDEIRLVRMPRHNNRSTPGRLFAWAHYLIRVSGQALTEPGRPLLFIVTNPPLSPLVGLLAKGLRGQRYILLFYDMYPEVLERFRGLSKLSMVARSWRALNRLAVRHAAGVVTISPQLAETLDQYRDHTTQAPTVEIVTTWVDTDRICPLPKERNWFAREHAQVGKLTVLYSGNLGAVHDLTMLPKIAHQLRAYPDVHFLIIGEGAGRKHLETECIRLGLRNLTLLPWQKEEILPLSLATADIGIVALANGAEGISMPSKTYYMMAVGSALLGLSNPSSDLANLIHDHECGVNIVPGDVDSAVQAILQLRDQPAVLLQYRVHARQAAEKYFSRSICVPRMLDLIRKAM